ncbi:MAG: ROK family transcriptional regulator [Verrucomicrobiota bacterium]|jgi:predicted NBD/HSP70 family sugar kinase
MIVVPSKMGQLNKRAVLARLQVLGAASRAELAKSLGLSQPTTGKIVDDLLKLGLLREVDEQRGAAAALGRPGRRLRLDGLRPRFVAIELGVSETCLAALPLAAPGEDDWTVRVPTPATPPAWQRALAKAAPRLSCKDLWGVLVSVPGVVDESKGAVLFSPNLHWTEGNMLPGLIKKVWNAPVALVQEERALALGHHVSEPAQEDFLLVDFGEGVGGAAIVGGKLLVPPLPLSGEIGHTPVLGNKRPCGCGAVGCLETLVSTSGLLRSFAGARPGARADWPALERLIADEGLAPWLAEGLEAAAAAIAGALNVCGLRRVVVTGSVVELPPAVFRYLAAAIERGTLWARLGRIEVLSAPRRRSAGLAAAGIERLVLPMMDKK